MIVNIFILIVKREQVKPYLYYALFLHGLNNKEKNKRFKLYIYPEHINNWKMYVNLFIKQYTLKNMKW